MNPDRLLTHYERIADAPDAIARLRRFILDLAVRGKLEPQDPNDEPASELLKRIAKERPRANKRQQDAPEINHPEDLGKLPPSWCAVPLIALGSWAIGGGFPKNEQGLNEGPHFFLKVSDMNLPGNEKYITTSNNFIDDEAAERMRAKIHPPGTIIFPKIGGAIATNKRRILTKGSAIDNNCLGITFSSEVDTDWAYLLLTTLDFAQYQAGTAVPALQQGVLERIPVGLPPLAEQHRIVAKVDELMALCDRLEAARAEREATRDRLAAASLASLNETDPETFQDDARFALATLPALTMRPDQIKQLRQTILNLAVRGKLVPQDSNDEPASELLKRIAAEKARLLRTGEIKRDQSSPPLGPNDEQFDLPASWNWSRLRALTSSLGDGLHGTPNYSDGSNCYFINGNNLEDGKIVIKPSTKTVSLDEMQKHKKQLTSNSVLVSINGTLGKVAFYNSEKIILGKSACYFNLTEFTDKKFVKVVLDSPYFAAYAVRNATGTTIMNLSLKAMNEFPFPLPPLAEQHRIVTKVDELMALCDRLEVSLTAATTIRRSLLDALLAEALAPTEISMEAAE